MCNHDLARRAALAIMAMAGGVLAGVAPAAAQSAAKPDNVTHVRSADAHYDKTGPELWVEVTNDGVVSNFKEGQRTGTSLSLYRSAASWTLTVKLDLGQMRLNRGLALVPPGDKAGMPSITGKLSSPITQAWGDCKSQNATSGKCTCDLPALRPLQGEVGMGEVAKKKKDVEEAPRAEMDALEQDPIKIVRGLGGELFVIDHHHGALSFIQAGLFAGTCEIVAPATPLSTNDPVAFWAQLKQNKWVRLADENGKPIAPDALRKTLADLPDDPYRTLAWMVRKQDGYCRSLMKPSPPPFAEFLWADWMRERSDKLPLAEVKEATDAGLWGESKKAREAKQKKMLDAALKLAKSSDASGLPGYRGNKAVADCNPSGGGE